MVNPKLKIGIIGCLLMIFIFAVILTLYYLPQKNTAYCQKIYFEYSSKISNLNKTCVNDDDCIEKMYGCGICVSKNNNFNELDELYDKLLKCEGNLDPKIFYNEVLCKSQARCSCECINNTCQYNTEHCIR